MRGLGLAVAFGVLVVGTAAQAQVTVTSSSGSTVSTTPTNVAPVLQGSGEVNTDLGGAQYNSFVTVTPSVVSFESENVSSGRSVSTSSFSTVNLALHNTTGKDVTFQSTITPAGLGLYLADTSTGCLYTGCAPVSSSVATFRDLTSAQDSSTLAQVGFSFDVSRQAPGADTVSLFHLNGSLVLSRNSDGVFVSDLLGTAASCDGDVCQPGTGPRGVLDGFNQSAPLRSGQSQVAFDWGATDISFDIGNAVDQTLVYTTQVFTDTGTNCVEGTSICLLGFSGFGDPVGRGGGIESNLVSSFFRSFALPQTGLEFGPTTFAAPTFVNGILTFGDEPNGAVPEPATWMTLILGFGLLGATLRRRRTVAAI